MLTPPLPCEGEAFYKKSCGTTSGSAAQPPRRGSLELGRPPCVKGAPAKRVRDCLISNPSVSYADTSPSKEGEAFYKKYCVATPRSAMQPHTGEALALLRPPCAKGAAAKRVGDCFLHNPSDSPAASHLPLHRGGFYKKMRHYPRSYTATPTQRRLRFRSVPLVGRLA